MRHVRRRSLELPYALRIDGLGYQSGVIGLPANQAALLVVYAGTAVRCLRIAPDGSVTVVRGIRGPLRDAERQDASHVWLLTTHGLQLVDLSRDTVISTVREGLPAYGARLVRLDENRLVVSKTLSTTAAVVSIHEERVIQRVRMPTVDHVVRAAADRLTLCSFERGVARPIDDSLHRAGPDQPLPTGHALRMSDGVAVVFTDLVPALAGSTITMPRSRGVVARFDDRLVPGPERTVDGLTRLDGVSGDGTLVGVSLDSIVLLAPDSLAEVGRTAPVGNGPTVGAVGDRQAVALAMSRSLVPAISLVDW